jgi:hypothetical protein
MDLTNEKLNERFAHSFHSIICQTVTRKTKISNLTTVCLYAWERESTGLSFDALMVVACYDALISNHIRSDKKTGLINRRSLLLSEASDT